MLTIVAWRIDVQDCGGGRKEKMSLGMIQNEFAMRFSVNQGFRPEMSSLVFYSAVTKAIPVFSHPEVLKETSDVYKTRTGWVRMLRPSCRKLRITSDRFSRSNV